MTAPRRGREAEELRVGIEVLIERYRGLDAATDDGIIRELGELLDEVDARDSLSYVQGRARRNRAMPKRSET